MNRPARPVPAIGLIGLAFDRHSSFLRGCAQAPPRIREALFSEASHTGCERGFDVRRHVKDFGDVLDDAADSFQTGIPQAIEGVLDDGLVPLSLGGDHAVTFPVLQALGPHYKRLTILQFDAHPDLYHDFEGNPHSHASPMARIMENGLATRLVQIGIRTLNDHQRRQAERFGVEIIAMRDFRDGLTLTSEDPVYISFDLDGLDPSCAPGVSHHEPGGLTTRQALDVMDRLHGQIVGADIVEYNPTRDIHGMTAMVAAKLVKELAGKMIDAEQAGIEDSGKPGKALQ